MNVTHKLLDSGYHHVRAVGYAHLFAQWPIGTQLAYDRISQGEFQFEEITLAKFIDAAQRAADTVESELREQREADLRARLDLEQRDEPRERGYSMIDDDSGQAKQGPL